MGIFDFFKKKNPDPKGDYSIQDLNAGFILDYDFESWEVSHVGTYDWGREEFSYEATLSNGKERKFLEFTDSEHDTAVWYVSISAQQIPSALLQELENGQKPNREFVFEGKVYKLHENSAGFYSPSNGDKEDWAEFMCFEYRNSENEILTITQWDDSEFEFAKGQELQNALVQGVLPGKL